MGSVKRFWATLLLLLPQARAESLPAAIVHRPFHHQLAYTGGMNCTGYHPLFQLAGGALPEGVRLHPDGRVEGKPARIETGLAMVRVSTPCSEAMQEWGWTVRGAPMLFVEPAEIQLDSKSTQAAALVSASWHGLAYSITTADGGPLPPWLTVRPRRGKTPPEGSALTGDRLEISVEPSVAPPGAAAELLIYCWRGSDPARLTVRFGPSPGGRTN